MSAQLERRTVDGTSYLTGGEGHPVVFLHGIPGSALTWERVATTLADEYRVVVPDLRGFGHSAPADDYYMSGQARALSQLLTALDVGTCSVVTHDFGGPVALTLVDSRPELTVDRVVLASTNVFTDTHVPLPLRVAGVPLLGTVAFQLLVGNRFGMRLLYQNAVVRTDAVAWSRFQRHLTPSCLALTRRIFQRSLADLDANYAAIERVLPTLECPALVLWGDSDPFFSTTVGERTRDALPDADLRVYDRTGHFVPEERPSAVAKDLRAFLAH